MGHDHEGHRARPAKTGQDFCISVMRLGGLEHEVRCHFRTEDPLVLGRKPRAATKKTGKNVYSEGNGFS